MSDQEIVMKKVWNLFDMLRGDINTEDYSVVLLFIYLRSETVIAEKLLNSNNIKSELLQLIHQVIDASTNEVLHDVVNIFQPSLEILSERTVQHIVEALISIDSNWLNENIAYVFDSTLQRMALSQGRRGGEFIQPKELTQFINAYVGNANGLNVYNPFAGVASFIKDYQGAKNVYAQELNRKTWAIGQLRLLAFKSNANFKCEDSINGWQSQTKFDLIVSNPPFGLRLDRQYREQYAECRTAEEFLVSMSMNSLSHQGQLLAVLPNGILFRGGSEQRLRERLIQEDLIDTIISFPGGVLYHTGIPFIVLILNKSKKYPAKIRLVDATSFVKKPSSREHIIEGNELLNAIKNYDNSDFVRIIDNEEVIANDFNLNIPRYFQEDIEGVKLRDILTYIRGERRGLPEEGKLIRVRDLKDDKTDFQLDIKQVEGMPLTRPDIHRIDASCLLLTIRWKTLKPTYFQFDDEPIFRGSDILPFEVDEEIADVAYLASELHADYVEQQLDGFRQGAAVPFIRRDDLLEVKIKLPSIEEQRAKVAGLKEISEKIRQLQSERNALAHGINAKEFNEFASLKHTLGRPRQNILGWSKNLARFFEREKDTLVGLNAEFKELFDLGIIEAIGEINRDIKFISDVLEKGENGLVLNDYTKSNISLSELNNIINELSNNGWNFAIKKQLLKADEMKNRAVCINKLLLKTLLDNLLTNANKYGFQEKKDGNVVRIEVSEVEDQLIIDVRNNGLPFPKNFDREKFITKYSTADSLNGSGLGGYDINRIASYFENKDWELVLNEDPIYPVIFRFSLPIKLMN